MWDLVQLKQVTFLSFNIFLVKNTCNIIGLFIIMLMWCRSWLHSYNFIFVWSKFCLSVLMNYVMLFYVKFYYIISQSEYTIDVQEYKRLY